MKGYNGNFNTGQDDEMDGSYDNEAASLCGLNQDPSLIRFARKCINYGKMTTLSGDERIKTNLKACNAHDALLEACKLAVKNLSEAITKATP